MLEETQHRLVADVLAHLRKADNVDANTTVTLGWSRAIVDDAVRLS